MVKVTITMAAVQVPETGKWRTEIYCYEEDDGRDQVRDINAATRSILGAIEKGEAEGAKPFVHGKPPEGAVLFWDIWVGMERITSGKWVDTCDYRRHPGCPQAMVAKMMDAYKLLCADCAGQRTRKRRKHEKGKNTKQG